MYRRMLPLALACLVGLTVQPALQAAQDLTGTWKLTVYFPTSEMDLCLLKIIREDNQQWRATVIARGLQAVKRLTAEKIEVLPDRLKIVLDVGGETFVLTARLPDAKGTKLYASLTRRADLAWPAILERTQANDFAGQKTARQSAAHEAYIKAGRTANVEQQRDLLRELLKQHGDHPVAIYAAVRLVDHAADYEDDRKITQTLAQDSLQRAEIFGRDMVRSVAWQLGQILLQSAKARALAASYIQKAVELLDADTPADFQERAYKALAKAYRAAGEPQRAEALTAKIAELEKQADAEYRRKMPPFKITPAQPRDAEGRAVVLELFTGTQCPPCVAADVACDAIAQTYPTSEVILLQYHLHIPGPDPLTNPETERRSEFYGVRGTPTAFLNGKPTPPLGGALVHAEERYRTLVKLIEAERQQKPACRVQLSAHRQGDQLDIEATVTGLANPPEKARLLLVLVEEEVRYAAPNGIRFHHHVVRAFPGGQQGFALQKDKTHQKVRVVLSDLRKDLHSYLNRVADSGPFPDDDRPLELRKLKVVALIQDLATREILHASITAIPE